MGQAHHLIEGNSPPRFERLVYRMRGLRSAGRLLDAEPRSASVTAVERSRLFRLAQADFYSLVSERPDITHAINRALCQMVRKANASS